MNRRIYLLRHEDDGRQTVGHLFVYEKTIELARFATLELPWRNNERNTSCIPVGTYPIRPRTTEKFGRHFIIEKVPDRTGILIHVGNFNNQTRGCILIGTHHNDLNSDSLLDLANSKAALARLATLVTQPTTITIVKGGEISGV